MPLVVTALTGTSLHSLRHTDHCCSIPSLRAFARSITSTQKKALLVISQMDTNRAGAAHFQGPAVYSRDKSATVRRPTCMPTLDWWVACHIMGAVSGHRIGLSTGGNGYLAPLCHLRGGQWWQPHPELVEDAARCSSRRDTAAAHSSMMWIPPPQQKAQGRAVCT